MDIVKIIFTVFLGISIAFMGCSKTSSTHPANQTDNSNNDTTTDNHIVIAGIQPANAYANAVITITGTGFGPGSDTVMFDNTIASIQSWSDTSISAVVPDMTAGIAKVSISALGHTSNSVDFTVLPFISGTSKSDCVLNDIITIQGTGFGDTQGNGIISYAGTNLPVSSWSAHQINAVIGNISHISTGQANVIINNAASNGVTLTVHPSINSLTPDTLERGDVVTINGNLFGSTQGTSTVTLSGITAAALSWSDTVIKAVVHDKAIKGDAVVSVSNILSAGYGFTVTKAFYSINQPTGLAMDKNENLYVANYTDGTIIQVLPGGITQTTLYKGLAHPMGLYYQAPSTLFVACEGDGTIHKLTLGDPVTGYTFASGFSQPAGIAFDDAGNMYVTNYGNNTISKIDLSGAVSTFAIGLNKPMGIVFTGPAGGKTFKVVNSGNGTIVLVDLLGVVYTFVSGLNTEKYIIADNAYNLYVTSNNTIIKVLLSGFTLTYSTGMSNPYGLTMDPSGYIYASNFDDNTISKIDNSYQVYAKGLYNPYGITFSNSGTMFITNQGEYGVGGSISMVTLSGEVKPFVKPFDHSDCNPSNMIPVGITTGFGGNLFVAVSGLGSSAISEVTYDGNASVFGSCFIYFTFGQPSALTFSSGTQRLYMADAQSGNVFTMASSASSLYRFAQGFRLPNGIAIDQSGRVYIANAGNGTISQTTLAGTFTTTYASGFSQPSGIAFDNKGNLYVSNYAGNAVSLVTAGQQIYTIAAGIQKPNGIAIDNAGYVYVASETAGKVYRLVHPAIVYASGFNAPKGLTKGIDGLIYIADSINNSIYRLEASEALTNFAMNITSPAWFSFDNANNMFLSSFSDSTILRLLNNNLSTFVTGLNGPTGIAYDSLNGLLYVGNYLNGTLSIVNNLGNVSNFVVGLSGPMGVVLLSPGNLYVANSSNGTIAKVVQGSGVSILASGFGMPIGITLDNQSIVYVADQLAGMIFTVGPTGGVTPFARVNSPYGIAFDGQGNLFVSNNRDKQIKKLILH